MRIDVRPVQRLRGPDPVRPRPPRSLGLLRRGRDSRWTWPRLRVVCDWIQYRQNFRELADCRPVLSRPRGHAGPDPAAIGPGRRWRGTAAGPWSSPSTCAAAGGADLARGDRAAGRAGEPAARAGCRWSRGARARQSCIWRFNTLYWQALVALGAGDRARSTSRPCPAGESDARNTAAARELILELFKIWDDLDAGGALPDELYVVELGVGNGSQARTWLDEFAALDRAHGRDYYRRLHYLMGDYSAARARPGPEGGRAPRRARSARWCSTRPARRDAWASCAARRSWSTSPTSTTTCPPTRWPASAGAPTRCEVRPTCPAPTPRRIARQFSAPAGELPDLIGQLLRLGPELLCEALPQHFADAGRRGRRSGGRSGPRCGCRSATCRSRAWTPTASAPT